MSLEPKLHRQFHYEFKLSLHMQCKLVSIINVSVCMCMHFFSAPTCWSCRSVWHMLVLKSSCLCSWLTCSCQWNEPSAKDSSEAQRRFSCRRVPPCWLVEWLKLLDCCCCLALVLLWRGGFPPPSPEKAAGGFRLLRTQKVNTLFYKPDYTVAISIIEFLLLPVPLTFLDSSCYCRSTGFCWLSRCGCPRQSCSLHILPGLLLPLHQFLSYTHPHHHRQVGME